MSHRGPAAVEPTTDRPGKGRRRSGVTTAGHAEIGHTAVDRPGSEPDARAEPGIGVPDNAADGG
jgi:hypothetical protein